MLVESDRILIVDAWYASSDQRKEILKLRDEIIDTFNSTINDVMTETERSFLETNIRIVRGGDLSSYRFTSYTTQVLTLSSADKKGVFRTYSSRFRALSADRLGTFVFGPTTPGKYVEMLRNEEYPGLEFKVKEYKRLVGEVWDKMGDMYVFLTNNTNLEISDIDPLVKDMVTKYKNEKY